MLLSGLGLTEIAYTRIGSDGKGRKTNEIQKLIATSRRFDLFLTSFGHEYIAKLKADNKKNEGYLIDDGLLWKIVRKQIGEKEK